MGDPLPRVFIDGIRVPYVRTKTKLDANSLAPLGSIGANLAEFPTTNSPTVNYLKLSFGDNPGVPGEFPPARRSDGRQLHLPRRAAAIREVSEESVAVKGASISRSAR